jgi:hypothetical protein
MRSAELIVYGIDGTLAAKLAAWALDRGYWNRTVSSVGVLIGMFRKGSDGVLVVRLGRDLVAEFEAVHLANEFGLATIVIADAEYPATEGMAYDLGADVVVFTPDGAEQIFEVLSRIADLRAK